MSTSLILSVDRNSFDPGADHTRIGIERSDNAEALRRKALVPQAGPGPCFRRRPCDRPLPVRAQDVTNLGDQLMAPIPDAGMAEMAEIRQVFANLGVGEAQHFSQLAGADRGSPLADQILQLSQVKAEPTNDDGGDLPLLRRVTFASCRAQLRPIRAERFFT